MLEVSIPIYFMNQLENKEFIGCGTYGNVYLGFLNDRRIAVKFFTKIDESSKREIEILTTISHPNIVALHGIVVQDKYWWTVRMSDWISHYCGYVMDYFEGGCLHNALYKTSIPYNMSTICRWIVQIGSALQYLHENGISHGDIKPSNILLGKNCVKLADFGIGRIFHSGNDEDFSFMDSVYTAPEVGTSGYNDHLADIFALGVTIWELIYRLRPSEYITDGHGELHIELPTEEMDPRIALLVRRCWSRLPQSRPSLQELIKCFEAHGWVCTFKDPFIKFLTLLIESVFTNMLHWISAIRRIEVYAEYKPKSRFLREKPKGTKLQQGAQRIPGKYRKNGR